MMDLQDYLNQCSEQVDLALDRWLPDEQLLPGSLHQSMRYSVFAGGKRLRPILMIAACEAVGGDASKTMHAACAMELIHTYSLIHDDLPAMDDDDYRRGQLTNHKVFGEATAILAGDALLTEAFRLLADKDVNVGLRPEVTVRVIEIVARYAGSQGMVGGQVVDMESEGKKDIDFPTLEYIHTHKTGGLILASVQVGALLGDADNAQFESITKFGGAAGLAFQIADDILDIVGDQDKVGKDIGSDQARGKVTYPALLGLDEARQRALELCDIAVNALTPLGDAAGQLQALAHYMVKRNF